jgi:diguanylate cyclase (GGDEF)-like protein
MSVFSSSSAAAAQLPPDGEVLPSGRILIVDDLEDNRAILSRRFVKRGFEIMEASNGEEALDLVRQHDFDVILLDVMMPGMDGAECLARIRKDYPSTTLPVIMVTAKSQSEDIVDALRLGANDYVTKPVDFSVALARVNKQIAIRRAELDLLKSNENLRDAKTLLERRVSERGAMLVKANAAVQDEIARRVASEDRIAYLARHDTLTGLANRFTFDERLLESRQFARDCGSQLSLLFIDLDGFKNVNDTLGHGVGDELLKQVAEKLCEVIGAKDFCARLGGDEFAIVHVSEDAQTTAAVLAQSVIAAVCECQVVGGNQVFVGASVGIAVLHGGDNDAATLLKQADLAMYRAKADGRGVFRFFEAEMAERAAARRSLEIDLRKAVVRGDFQLYYQPLVDLKTGGVTGLEALLRWNHPTRGFVPPVEFIALAEETGLIVPLGEWALRQACADAAQWTNPLRVAINLSPIQFRNLSLVTVVMSALSSSGLPADRLELEITESVVLGNNPQNLKMLRQLRALGARISLDDFGTGYSGLGYFRSFQFDRIKIDQTFVREMQGSPESRAIVRAAIGLGENMGIFTTAEGVETIEQLQCLVQEGCTEVQGFLFSAPQPQANIAKMIEDIRAGFSAAGP